MIKHICRIFFFILSAGACAAGIDIQPVTNGDSKAVFNETGSLRLQKSSDDTGDTRMNISTRHGSIMVESTLDTNIDKDIYQVNQFSTHIPKKEKSNPGMNDDVFFNPQQIYPAVDAITNPGINEVPENVPDAGQQSDVQVNEGDPVPVTDAQSADMNGQSSNSGKNF